MNDRDFYERRLRAEAMRAAKERDPQVKELYTLWQVSTPNDWRNLPVR